MGYRAKLRVVPWARCPKCHENDAELFNGYYCHACSWIWVPTNEERAAFFHRKGTTVAEQVAYEVHRGRVGGIAFRALFAAGRIAIRIGVALGRAFT